MTNRDQTNLASDARLHDLAAILATGVLRMRRAASLASSANPANPAETCLDVHTGNSLTVTRGLTRPRVRERSKKCR